MATGLLDMRLVQLPTHWRSAFQSRRIEQIVGRERRERVSQLDSLGDA
jgi:hypothetical protein